MDDAEKWDCEGDGDSTGAGHNADGRNKRKGQRREKPVQGEETVGGCIGGWNKEGGRAIKERGIWKEGRVQRGSMEAEKYVNFGKRGDIWGTGGQGLELLHCSPGWSQSVALTTSRCTLAEEGSFHPVQWLFSNSVVPFQYQSASALEKETPTRNQVPSYTHLLNISCLQVTSVPSTPWALPAPAKVLSKRLRSHLGSPDLSHLVQAASLPGVSKAERFRCQSPESSKADPNLL